MIELRDVTKELGGRRILDRMTLSVPRGMNYVLMGPSGCGKSVTLKHVIGIFSPDQGEVLVDGMPVPTDDRAQLMNLRRRMGYLFQHGALINWLSVAENVALPLREHTRLQRREIGMRVQEVLAMVGLEHCAAQAPSDISGGMKLRAGLARALITQPEYVLYDEPNAGLDPLMAIQIHELIVEVRNRLGVTGLVVTHSRACALHVADRIGIIDRGRIAVEGTPQELQHSDHPLAKAFLSGDTD